MSIEVIPRESLLDPLITAHVYNIYYINMYIIYTI